MSRRGNISSPAATMSSVQALREFINERLAAAAGEIFTVFQQSIVQYEEEIHRQLMLLGINRKPRIKFHRAESPQQHIGSQKTSSSVEQEEHEAPHIKEEEDLVEETVTECERDNTHGSVRDLTTQRLTAAAVEIFTLFQPTIVRYQEEIARQHKLLEIICKPQIKLHRTELQQHHDCREEQLFEQETNYSLEQEESAPPQIKEEPVEPEPPQIKEEPEEPEPPQIKEEQEELKQISIFQCEVVSVENVTVPEKQAEGEKLLSEETSGGIVRKKPKLCQNVRTLTDKKKNNCEICGKGYNRQSEFLVHMRNHTGEKPYSCETCGKSFVRQSVLLLHMRTHTGEKPYSCGTCGKSFRVSGSLLVHMITHTGEKPYSCETCEKRFGRRSTLLRHMRTHTGEKPYSCETCGKSFITQNKLLVHVRSHTGEKPYSCETCGTRFSVHGSLLSHMRTHTGEKPFSCETCGKSFSKRSNMLVHIKTHTGERPHSCETCGKGFIQHSKLMLHIRTHTGEKPYSCEKCGKRFCQKNSLWIHMRTHM